VTNPPREAQAIADGLTKAQREALLFWREGGVAFPPHLVDAGYELLEMKVFGARPTALGLAVRSILQKESQP